MGVEDWWRKHQRKVECQRKYGKGRCPHLERHAKLWVSYGGTGGMPVQPLIDRDDEATVAMGRVFTQHLQSQGWEVLHREDTGFVLAMHGTETIAAELEARTGQPGDDMDKLYGRLLRRLADYSDGHVVGVVPERMRWHVGRVPESVRHALHIDIYLVDDLGFVRRLQPEVAEATPDPRALERLSATLESLRTPPGQMTEPDRLDMAE